MNRVVKSGETAESDDGNQSALSPNIEAGNNEVANSIPTETEPLPGEDDRYLMLEAAREGDWAAAEPLLKRFKRLAWDWLSGDRDRALHVAVRGKHTEFVHELVKRLKPEELSLTDGGYTACSYAAKDGTLELARILVEANPSVVTAREYDGRTPLRLALYNEKTEIFEYFLSIVTFDDSTKEVLFACLLDVISKKRLDLALQILEKNTETLALMFDDSMKEELFACLLGAIDRKRLDLALKILEKDTVSLALMKDRWGRTALHVLAQLDMSRGWKIRDPWKLQDDFDLLAKRLWEVIKDSESDKGLELVKFTALHYLRGFREKRYSILHDAAKVGNLRLIKMITDDFPHLLSHPDKEGCSVFHMIVMCRRETNIKLLFELLEKAEYVKDDGEIFLDEDGNNILHEAAKSRFPTGLEIVADQDLEMQRAFLFFKAVGKIVPPIYREMRNEQGCVPLQLFWKEHGKILAASEAYLKKTAESSMLISTIVLSLVFAAAFAPPGGFNKDTGIPILWKNKWFTSFTVFQLLALCSSTVSIIGFWSIISSQSKDYQFTVWPNYLRVSMCFLLLSVFFVISAFLSAFLLVFVQERKKLAMSFIIPIYISFFVVIVYQVLKVLRKINRHSLMEPSSIKFNTLRGRVSTFLASLVRKKVLDVEDIRCADMAQ